MFTISYWIRIINNWLTNNLILNLIYKEILFIVFKDVRILLLRVKLWESLGENEPQEYCENGDLEL